MIAFASQGALIRAKGSPRIKEIFFYHELVCYVPETIKYLYQITKSDLKLATFGSAFLENFIIHFLFSHSLWLVLKCFKFNGRVHEISRTIPHDSLTHVRQALEKALHVKHYCVFRHGKRLMLSCIFSFSLNAQRLLYLQGGRQANISKYLQRSLSSYNFNEFNEEQAKRLSSKIIKEERLLKAWNSVKRREKRVA